MSATTAVSSTQGALQALSVGDNVKQAKNSGRTFVFIKPDIFEKNAVGQVISAFEAAGITVIAMKQLYLTKAEAGRFYAEHEGKKFFAGLVDYVTRGPILAMVLKVNDAVNGEEAVKIVRTLMGATNPTQADPSSIRGRFGTSLDNNVVHGSDSPEAVERETAFFFSNRELPA